MPTINLPKGTLLSGAALEEALAAAGRASATSTNPLFRASGGAAPPPIIEVGEKAAPSIIVREGVEVRAPTLDKGRVEEIKDKLRRPPVTEQPRVIDQSVPAGTHVPRGTIIDIVLAPPADVELGILGLVHLELAARPITFLADAVKAPAVAAIIARAAAPADLTQQDRDALTAAAGTLNITVDPDPASDRSVDRLYRTLAGAKTFL
jgi:hypothetical protein